MAKRYQRGNQNQSFHCIVCSSSIYWFWLPLCYLLAIVCSSSIYWFWLPLWYPLAIVLSVRRRFTDSDCPFGIFWPLFCVSVVDWLILPKDTKGVIRITKSTKNTQYNGQKIPKGQSESVNRRRTNNTMAQRYQRGNQNQIVFSLLRRFTDSDYPFGISWPLYCLFFVDLLILIAPLGSFGHCIVCSSSIYRFWLPLSYLLAIVLSKAAIRISKSTKNRQYNGQKIPKG
jgi:hypothetical protein